MKIENFKTLITNSYIDFHLKDIKNQIELAASKGESEIRLEDVTLEQAYCLIHLGFNVIEKARYGESKKLCHIDVSWFVAPKS